MGADFYTANLCTTMERSAFLRVAVPVNGPAYRRPAVCEASELFFRNIFSDDDVKKIAKEVIQLRDQLGRNSDNYFKACIKFPKENVFYNCLCGIWLGTAGKKIYTRLKRHVSLEYERQKKSKEKRAFKELTNTLINKIKSKESLQRRFIDQGKALDKLRVSYTECKKKMVKHRRRAESAQIKLDGKEQVINIIIYNHVSTGIPTAV